MVSTAQNFDAVVVGAGFSGMYMLKALRDKLGLKVRVYEAGETVGGTWYWNRYPGARCDSESYVYCFTWDKQLLQEWQWSERYPEQPEILRYLEHVAQRHDLKRDIQFSTRVTSAEFDETTTLWTVRTDTAADVTGSQLSAAFRTQTSRHSRASRNSEASGVIRAGSPEAVSISLPSGSQWSGPAPPPSRPFPKLRSRPSS